LAWLWVMVNTMVAFFAVQASRSQVAFEALVERWAGILVSDGSNRVRTLFTLVRS
jgi:transposase